MYEQRKGMYIHALEVENSYELESILDSLVNEFSKLFTDNEIQEFIDTLEVYYIGEDPDEEEQIYETWRNFKVN
jgi:hypothetical protein